MASHFSYTPMDNPRILFVTMEVDPFLKLTSVASAIKRLPTKLQDKGYEIRILMPRFGVINERRNRLHEVVRLSGINIRMGNEEKPLMIKVASIPNARLQVYFLDNDDYFKRKAVFDNPKTKKFLEDNVERAAFFSRGVIETVKKLGWNPSIVHCHGWFTSLVPLYLKTSHKEDPLFTQTKVVQTLYNHPINEAMNDADFKTHVQIDGVPDSALEAYLGGSYLGFAQGSALTADAVSKGQPDIDPELEAFFKEKGLEVPYDGSQGDETAYVEYYHNLYQSLLGA